LPWLLVASSILVDYRGNGDSPALLDALIRAQSTFVAGESAHYPLRWAWASLTLAAMCLGALKLWDKQRASLTFLVLYWLIPLAATWVSSLNRPIFNERYLVAIVPPVYLLMAAAVFDRGTELTARWSQWLGRAIIVLVVAGMALGIVQQGSDPLTGKTRGWRELATVLDELTAGVDRQRVRLVQNFPDPSFQYYYQGDVATLLLPPSANNVEQSRESVNMLSAVGISRVLLVEQPAQQWDAAGIAHTAIGEEYSLAATKPVGSWMLTIWLRPPGELDAPAVAYEGGLHLAGAQFMPGLLHAGGLIEVYLRWQGNEGSQEAVSVQLINSAGELVAQSDRPLEMASDITAGAASYAILLPRELAAGEYQLNVVIYDPTHEGAPRRLTMQGADSVLLGSVRVVKPE
jgi:hypothetical protein